MQLYQPILNVRFQLSFTPGGAKTYHLYSDTTTSHSNYQITDNRVEQEMVDGVLQVRLYLCEETGAANTNQTLIKHYVALGELSDNQDIEARIYIEHLNGSITEKGKDDVNTTDAVEETKPIERQH